VEFDEGWGQVTDACSPAGEASARRGWGGAAAAAGWLLARRRRHSSVLTAQSRREGRKGAQHQEAALGTRRKDRTEGLLDCCSECSLLGLAFGRKRSIGPSFGGLREVLKKIWAKFQGSPEPTWTTLWARHCTEPPRCCGDYGVVLSSDLVATPYASSASVACTAAI
jgi:MYXO-CTERM domain-containing protein